MELSLEASEAARVRSCERAWGAAGVVMAEEAEGVADEAEDDKAAAAAGMVAVAASW